MASDNYSYRVNFDKLEAQIVVINVNTYDRSETTITLPIGRMENSNLKTVSLLNPDTVLKLQSESIQDSVKSVEFASACDPNIKFVAFPIRPISSMPLDFPGIMLGIRQPDFHVKRYGRFFGPDYDSPGQTKFYLNDANDIVRHELTFYNDGRVYFHFKWLNPEHLYEDSFPFLIRGGSEISFCHGMDKLHNHPKAFAAFAEICDHVRQKQPDFFNQL